MGFDAILVESYQAKMELTSAAKWRWFLESTRKLWSLPSTFPQVSMFDGVSFNDFEATWPAFEKNFLRQH
jgi:hypothetical protein